MKKSLLLFIALLFAPIPALGAFNDAVLTTDTIITVGGDSFSVYGSTSSLQSITVGASSFDVVMATGSTLTISSSANRTFSVTSDPLVTVTPACAGSYSTLSLSATGPATITVSVSGTCSYGGGGGGGGSAYSPPPPPPPPAPEPVATTTTTISPVATTTIVEMFGPTLTKTLAIGSTDAEVIDLQNFLIDRGLLVMPTGVPFGYFGKITEDAVKKFQVSANLEAVGIVGPKTREAIAKTTVTRVMSAIPLGFRFSRALKIGSSGADVAALQQILIAKGFLVFNTRSTPGYFGGLTKSALARFQRSIGLPAVGAVGPATRSALNTITGS